MENIPEYLLNNGIKPSYARIRIFECLINDLDHPTVLTIYETLKSEIPTLSKMTVYNTLNLFVEKKLVSTLIIKGNELHFDAIVKPHGHFTCEKCGKIFDFEVENDLLGKLKNFTVKSQQILITGYCDKCSD